MDNEIVVLLVEDQDSDKDVFTDTVKYSAPEGIEITVLVRETTSEAKTILSERHIDACVVDLKLKGEDNGEQLIDEIVENFHVPTFVYSGTPNESNYLELQPFFKIYKKGENGAIESILSDIVKLYQTGVTRVIEKESLFRNIQELLPKIFWKHLPYSVNYWIDNNDSKSLQRYILTHVKEYLEYNEEGYFEEIEPAEVYITPPITENLMTGNILLEKESGKKFLLMTPACDLIIRGGKCKADRLVLVEFIKWDRFIKLEKDLEEHDEKEKEKLCKRLKESCKSARYYWMPNHSPIDGYSLDFQSINNPLVEDVKELYEVLASVVSSFMKDITANFSYYYSRQGAPEWDKNASMKKCFE